MLAWRCLLLSLLHLENSLLGILSAKEIQLQACFCSMTLRAFLPCTCSAMLAVKPIPLRAYCSLRCVAGIAALCARSQQHCEHVGYQEWAGKNYEAQPLHNGLLSTIVESSLGWACCTLPRCQDIVNSRNSCEPMPAAEPPKGGSGNPGAVASVVAGVAVLALVLVGKWPVRLCWAAIV